MPSVAYRRMIMTAKIYRKMLNGSKYTDLSEEVVDQLMFGQETRTSVLREEIFFLRNQLETAEPYMIPFLEDLIQEKELLRESIKSERS